jgi:hypothetical protein
LSAPPVASAGAEPSNRHHQPLGANLSTSTREAESMPRLAGKNRRRSEHLARVSTFDAEMQRTKSAQSVVGGPMLVVRDFRATMGVPSSFFEMEAC